MTPVYLFMTHQKFHSGTDLRGCGAQSRSCLQGLTLPSHGSYTTQPSLSQHCRVGLLQGARGVQGRKATPLLALRWAFDGPDYSSQMTQRTMLKLSL